MQTIKLTTSQAVIKFLQNQYIEDEAGVERFFAGCLGIFGHGNVAGIGQALQQSPSFKYILTRNEQASVHIAIAYAKMKNRRGAWVCTSSIGPGATNMITGAACATINRLPVLIIPGDIFAGRHVSPILQQLESQHTQDISVNDCFKPVSRYWDRINRPEQIISSLPQAMRVLLSPSETGAVTISIPQDVQAEAYDFPIDFFKKKIHNIARLRPDSLIFEEAVKLIKQASKPIIIAGGGVIYSKASKILEKFVKTTGIPSAETFAGKGSLPYNHPMNLGAIGATGTKPATIISAEADLVIGIGTRYSDFTTASKTAFQNPKVKFININITEFDSFKLGALPLVGDARVCIEELLSKLKGYKTKPEYINKIKDFNKSWDNYVTEVYKIKGKTSVSQAEVIGTLNDFVSPEDVLVCAAGSLPGDLHKLWRTTDPKGFHLEYGYSTMGYECAAGLGVKMADPNREVWVMVGDGNYLMMNNEIITSLQEGVKYNIILLDNQGFASIGALSQSLGSQRFGTQYNYRNEQSGELNGAPISIDFIKNAQSLGANTIKVSNIEELKSALKKAKRSKKTTVIVISTDLYSNVPGHAWWEVPVAQVSEMDTVNNAYKEYIKNKMKQRNHL